MKKEKKKGFIQEFKEFISRGSVMDLAVGIIIGSAFTAIVTSLVNDVITPVVGLAMGGIDFSKLSITIPGILTDEPAVLNYGSFIQSIVNFLIIAFCVFVLIKFINNLKTRMEKDLLKKEEEKETEKKEEPAAPDPQLVLLEEIRDLLKKD